MILIGVCSLFLESLLMIEALGRTGMREPGIGISLPTGAIGRLRETAGSKLIIVARVGCGEHAVF